MTSKLSQAGRAMADTAKEIDLTQAIAAVDGAAEAAKLKNGKGEISKWRVAKAAARPSKTSKRLVSGATRGLAQSARAQSETPPSATDVESTTDAASREP